MKITHHAAERFVERIRKTNRPFDEIEGCLRSASPEDMEIAELGGRVFSRLGCCAVICQAGRVLTVLPRDADEKKPADVPHTKSRKLARPRVCRYCHEVVEGQKALMRHVQIYHMNQSGIR